MKSIEEKVEDIFKRQLDDLKIKRYGKTEAINPEIEEALKDAASKSGGSGGNRPDIQCYLDDGHGRRIPVMLEAKGSKGRLEKVGKDGCLLEDTKSVTNYAVNGAVHYARAVINGIADCTEALAIGLNGSGLDASGEVTDLTCKAYYISKDNADVPIHVPDLDGDLTLLAQRNVPKLFKLLDEIELSEEEREAETRRIEERLEASVKSIHQSLYDDNVLKTVLGTNEKLYLFCGLIMAGLKTEGLSELRVVDLKGDGGAYNNDGQIIIRRIRDFLGAKNCPQSKIDMIMSLLEPVFNKKQLWQARNGVSSLREIYSKIESEVIPCLEPRFHLDFAGRILNSLNDWVNIENDRDHDVVLTPRYVCSFMARLCRTDMNSLVWDKAMGSAGFLVSAMDIMIRDAQAKIKDEDALAAKIKHIKEHQLLGIEILGNIYILAVLNMILMGDGSSNMICDNSLIYKPNFDANVFLLNPPYSADGCGLVFVEDTLKQMHNGYAAILIQENVGSSQGLPYTKRILENNTLIASIHMPAKLFTKASVQAAIYVFKVQRPHEPDDIVKFIDMSEDGYTRQNRKKSTQEVNLRDTDHAKERYAEVEALVLGKKPKTAFYTRENGLYIEDVIGSEGNDWTVMQHRKIDTVPTEEDFKKVVSEWLSFRVSQLMRGGEI